MIKKGSKLYSIIFGTCPKCQEESMYTTKNPYILADTLHMNENCSNCGFKYRIEPSFFYGSMYVSYGVGVAVAVATFIVSFVFFNSSLVTAFISIIASLIIAMPIIMRVSRNIWINMFVNYDKSLTKSSN